MFGECVRAAANTFSIFNFVGQAPRHVNYSFPTYSTWKNEIVVQLRKWQLLLLIELLPCGEMRKTKARMMLMMHQKTRMFIVLADRMCIRVTPSEITLK